MATCYNTRMSQVHVAGKRLCQALGLDPSTVRSITLRCGESEGFVATVELIMQADQEEAVATICQEVMPEIVIEPINQNVQLPNFYEGFNRQ